MKDPIRLVAARAALCAGLGALTALSACAPSADAPGPSAQTQEQPQRAPTQAWAATTAISANDRAEQLLDFAEQSYPEFFPSESATASYGSVRYRYYPATGTYVGVATSTSSGFTLNGVYIMGGPFGADPRKVGLLDSFITPVSPVMATAPTLASTFVAGLPHLPKGAGQPCADRTAWAGANARAQFLISRADTLLTQQFPPWDSAAYIQSSQTQLAYPGQDMVTERKRWLYPLVMAECATWTGKYLGRIDEVMQGLASQPSWMSPLVDKELVALNGIAYFQDLWSAATAADVAQTLYLLGDKLPASTRTAMLAALKARSFDPARTAVNQDLYSWWLTTNINWNAVLVGGTVSAALAVLPSRYERAWFASLGQYYIANYLAGLPASGYSTEGPSYWTYPMTYFSLLRQALYRSSGGSVDLFDTPKAQAASLFATRFTMTPAGVVAPFGDALAQTYMNYPVRQLTAAAYGSQSSGWPTAAEMPDFQNGNDSPIVLASEILSGTVPVVANYRSGEFTWPGLHTHFEDVGVVVSRSPLGEAKALAGTVKAAGSINHGHDDIGSYSIAMNESIIAGDVGIGVYTARTFSPDRRTIKWINSFGHPVPVVGGRWQLDAANEPNRMASTSFSDNADEVVINMAPAYALAAGSTLVRTFRNDRVARTISIRDDFTVPSAETFEVPITTLGAWTQPAANVLEIQHRQEAVHILIEASAPFTLAPETVSDDGLTFQRIAIRLNAAATTGWVKVTYSRKE